MGCGILLVLAFILIILIVLLTFIGMRRAAKKAAKDSPAFSRTRKSL